MKPETDEDLAQVVLGHGRCSYLLLSLFMLLIIYPYGVSAGLIGKIINTILLSLILIAGAYATTPNKQSLIAGVILAIVAAVLDWGALTGDEPIYFRILTIIYVVFLLYTIGSVLRYLLVKGPITADKLHGALSGFIMVAFLWAFLYSLLEHIVPGSFDIVHHEPGKQQVFYALLYFSFTTLTSVGFGDIIPVSNQARSLVIVEQLVGVFFVAVLIARLAGLYPPHND
jgi:hypothetical protein